MDAIVYDKVGKEAEKVREALYGLYPQATITDAAVASFDDGADNMPVKKLVAQIEPVQEGSGDPSPDNVRPISGWTSAEIEQTGKNLIPEVYNYYKHNPTFADAIFLRAGTYYLSYNVTGAANWRPTIRYYYPDGSINSDTEYKPNIDGSINNAYYDANLKAWQYAANTTTRSHTIIIPKDTWFVFFLSSGAVTSDTTISNAMMSFENNSTYAPYTGNQISVTFPAEAGTVYGGTLDVTSGVLTVDRVTRTLNGDETGWSINVYSSNPARAYVYNSSSSSMGNILTAKSIISSYIPGHTFTVSDTDIGIYVSGGYLWIRSGIMASMTVIEDWKNYLASNPLQIVYELAEPITYQLTPQQFDTLFGTNNIWADTGNIAKLTYRADLGKYIDSHITTAVADALNA